MNKKRVAAFVVSSVLLAGVVAGVASASIPDSSGVIHGCRNKITHQLDVIDTDAGQSCGALQTPLNWNQTGPQGPVGPAGPQGPKGDSGSQGLSGGSVDLVQVTRSVSFDLFGGYANNGDARYRADSSSYDHSALCPSGEYPVGFQPQILSTSSVPNYVSSSINPDAYAGPTNSSTWIYEASSGKPDGFGFGLTFQGYTTAIETATVSFYIECG